MKNSDPNGGCANEAASSPFYETSGMSEGTVTDTVEEMLVKPSNMMGCIEQET